MIGPKKNRSDSDNRIHARSGYKNQIHIKQDPVKIGNSKTAESSRNRIQREQDPIRTGSSKNRIQREQEPVRTGYRENRIQ